MKTYIDLNLIPDILKFSPNEVNSVIERKVKEIKEYFQSSGFDKAVIGLSGGIDSAVSAALTARALGPDNLVAVRLPFRQNNEQSLAIAKEIADTIGLSEKNLLTVDITSAVESAWETAKKQGGLNESLRIGNIAARMRMIILMDISASYKALLMGTENKTEEKLAYFTIGGDQISSVEPIHNLWKTHVYQLAVELGLPDSVLGRAPSAELWVGQTDEGEIGVSYVEIDTILAAQEKNLLPSKFGIDEETTKKVLGYVERVKGKREAPHIVF